VCVALAAVADHGHLPREEVEVAFAVDRGHGALLGRWLVR
jgi:hypothetical protein